MLENADINGSQNYNDEQNNSSKEYLNRAAQACAAGDDVLGMHLYLAAFEKAIGNAKHDPDRDAIEGLKQAWHLACRCKERSLAEYIFEKLEPYLSPDEIAGYAEQLQCLALDKLEEFGLSREDLESMTGMISQDLLGLDARLIQVEHIASPLIGKEKAVIKEKESSQKTPSEPDEPSLLSSEKKPEVGKSVAAMLAKAAEEAGVKAASTLERISYKDLAGYNAVIKVMRDFGIGLQDDPDYKSLIDLLNARHGLDRVPSLDTLLFCSPAREDAGRFMAATLGELDLPAIKMQMEENLQGLPVLCVMAQADNAPELNVARNAFVGRGVLMLEDLDLWSAPTVDFGDDIGGFIVAQLSRGAREAINLIRSAVENPDVYVLATASDVEGIDPFFLDLLDPLSVVTIDYPTVEERIDIWMEIAREHPSLRGVNRGDLVRYSAHMPRFDIYMAAREAIEESYKASLVARKYLPVTPGNLFEKLAAYQPLDSREYRDLEEAVLRNFRMDLERIDDILKDE